MSIVSLVICLFTRTSTLKAFVSSVVDLFVYQFVEYIEKRLIYFGLVFLMM